MKITVEGVTKSFGDTIAVDDCSIEAEEGELTTLLGPSGCGKTTLLRCIAGLESPDEGTISIGDVVVTDLDEGVLVPPGKRNIGMVFQTFDVWPHLSVFDNVAFPLRVRKLGKREIEEKVMEILELAEMDHLRDQNAATLSGGQQARIGIARALVYEPRVLLCDEPLTGLDRNLRDKMRYDIREIQKELGITTLYVTHSQREAMAISDKIILMKDGRVEQTGRGEEIYHNPQSRYTFDFFGSTELIDGTVTGPREIATDLGSITTNGVIDVDGDTVEIGFRPEDANLSTEEPTATDGAVWKGSVVEASVLGQVNEYIIDIEGTWIRHHSSRSHRGISPGSDVFVAIDTDDLYIFKDGDLVVAEEKNVV